MALEEHRKIPGSQETKRDLPQGRISRPKGESLIRKRLLNTPEYTVSENKGFLRGCLPELVGRGGCGSLGEQRRTLT